MLGQARVWYIMADNPDHAADCLMRAAQCVLRARGVDACERCASIPIAGRCRRMTRSAPRPCSTRRLICCRSTSASAWPSTSSSRCSATSRSAAGVCECEAGDAPLPASRTGPARPAAGVRAFVGNDGSVDAGGRASVAVAQRRLSPPPLRASLHHSPVTRHRLWLPPRAAPAFPAATARRPRSPSVWPLCTLASASRTTHTRCT